jgi:hypothetical protein
LADKLEQAETVQARSSSHGSSSSSSSTHGTAQAEKKKEEGPLSKVSRDASKLAQETISAAMNQLVKDLLFKM